MILKNLDNIIKIEKSRLQLYILIATLLPIVFLTIFLPSFYYKMKDVHSNNLKLVKKIVIEEKKIFLRDAIERTIFEIEQIREVIAKQNKLKSFTQKEIDAISIEKITGYTRDLRLTKEKYYIWINRIVDYNGGDNYAIRVVHPNLPHTEGTFLSTNTKDIEGNKPYETQLKGLKKDGELYFEYYFKKLISDKVSRKLSFAKLYKPFDWVIGTGIYLDDLDELISVKKHKMKEDFNRDKSILIIVSLVSILIIIIIVGFFQYHIKKLILSYEGKIDDYTKELEAMATTDQLTGLCNRLELDTIYSKELVKAARYNKIFSIIMIDIDYFKSVNDTYGHQVGDSVLKELSHILQSSVRLSDTVGRWGGEEFLIICYETNLDGALQLAEHIRTAIESYDFDVVGRKTSSFGVGTYHKNDTQESMIERADIALYCAKEEGRNAVRAEIYK